MVNTKFYKLKNACQSYLSKENKQLYYLMILKENWNKVLDSPIDKKIIPSYWQERILMLKTEDADYNLFVKIRTDDIASKVRVVLQNDFCQKIEIIEKKNFSKKI